MNAMSQPSQAFPIHALPEIVRSAVLEIHQNIQAPVAMIASSALGAISLSCHHAVDVKRPNGLVSPTSLYIIVAGDSGERKTITDRSVMKPIHELEERELAEAKAKMPEYEAKLTVWQIRLEHIQLDIRKAAKADNQEILLKLEELLKVHLENKPKAPSPIKLIYNNSTSEALLFGLSQCPSAGLMSNEGGNVMNGPVMRDMYALNSAWDGAIQTVDRRTSESFSLPDVRLTICSLMQSEALEKFKTKRGEEARGIGFLARVLFSYPESTQGYRFIGDDTLPWTFLPKYQERITEILRSHPISVDNSKQRKVLEFTTGAAAKWRDFYNEIEGLMQPGYWLCDVRDYASKVAENTARIAALLHFFEGAEGDIPEETMLGAIEIARYFVVEFKRLFGSEPPIPQEQKDALLLENWLYHQASIYNNNSFLKNKILQLGPNQLRNRDRLNAALDFLAFNSRVFFQRDKNRTFVILNSNR